MFYEDLGKLIQISSHELDLVAKITQHPDRPRPFRPVDQIYMLPGSQLNQAKLISDYIRGRDVVFLGDGDCMSLVIGILARNNVIKPPAFMRVLDFDDRIPDFIRKASREFGFENEIDAQRYNVRDPIPADLVGCHDVFYTNPPYGSKNNGKSGIIFLARCMELCKPPRSWGVAILPFHHTEMWSREAMWNIQSFLVQHGYVVSEMLRKMHSYHLDDYPSLLSGTVVLDRIRKVDWPGASSTIPYAEMEKFYGGTQKDFPDYIDSNGNPVYTTGKGKL